MNAKLYFFLFLFSLLALSAHSQRNPAVTAPVKLQLQGYNNRDITTFVKAFSDTVKVYRQPGVLTYQGKAALRERYAAMFAATPDLHCRVVKRMVAGEVVIDHERVRKNGQPRFEAIAVYRVRNGEIVEVTFIPPYSK